MDIVAAMKALQQVLEAGGLRATIDPRNAQPPCALIKPPEIAYRFGKGWDCTFHVWLMVPDSGHPSSLTTAGELLELFQDATGYRGVTARPDDVQLSDGATVPMYDVTFTERIPADA